MITALSFEVEFGSEDTKTWRLSGSVVSPCPASGLMQSNGTLAERANNPLVVKLPVNLVHLSLDPRNSERLITNKGLRAIAESLPVMLAHLSLDMLVAADALHLLYLLGMGVRMLPSMNSVPSLPSKNALYVV